MVHEQYDGIRPAQPRDRVRQALMRICVGFVFIWFGVMQLLHSGLVTHFVPDFMKSAGKRSGRTLAPGVAQSGGVTSVDCHWNWLGHAVSEGLSFTPRPYQGLFGGFKLYPSALPGPL